MIVALLAVGALGYLLGSVPTGLLLARLVKGADIRRQGSGNIGATNVLRVIGLPTAAAVLAFDVAKGALPVLVAKAIADSPAVEAVAAGTVIAGHTLPVWLRFRGGKGVAPALGALLVLEPLIAGVALGVAVIAIAATRFVSLGSLAGTLSALAMGFSFYWWRGLPAAHLLVIVATATAIVVRHGGNIARLKAGREAQLGRRATLKEDAP